MSATRQASISSVSTTYRLTLSRCEPVLGSDHGVSPLAPAHTREKRSSHRYFIYTVLPGVNDVLFVTVDDAAQDNMASCRSDSCAAGVIPCSSRGRPYTYGVPKSFAGPHRSSTVKMTLNKARYINGGKHNDLVMRGMSRLLLWHPSPPFPSH